MKEKYAMPDIKQPFYNSKRFGHSFIRTVEHVRQHIVYKSACNCSTK